MCASGNYKSHSIPEERAFIPAAVKPEQTQEQIVAELMKLARKPGEDVDARV